MRFLTKGSKRMDYFVPGRMRTVIKCKPDGRPEAANFSFLGWDLLISGT